MKKSIVAALLLSSSIAFAGLSDGEAAILGIFIGSQLQKNSQQYEQPRQVQRSNESYRQSRQYSDPCQNSYSSVDAAYCRGAQQRHREVIRNMEQDAFNRGYNGN